VTKIYLTELIQVI